MNLYRALWFAVILISVTFVGLKVLAAILKNKYVYRFLPEAKNPMEGKRVRFIHDDTDAENADGMCGHLVATGLTQPKGGIYNQYVKRAIDILLSFAGLLILSPVFLLIVAAIEIDDPGPVLFVQRRVGLNKEYFMMHKFRSMKMSTPHDKPTHMLENPEQYITRVGRFLRAHSLDELPQIWDIFVGNMSVVGPRPALWNQDFLTAERDKYDANAVKPGLTGWAQINGRDELLIPEKARLDGEYAQNVSLLFDLKCFFGSFMKVVKDDSVVEGRTDGQNKS